MSVTLDDLVASLRKRAALGPKLGTRIKFDLKGQGTILLDATTQPPEVGTEDGPADATITLAPETLAGLIEGQINPTFAYMSGKLKVAGSKSAAMQLGALLED